MFRLLKFIIWLVGLAVVSYGVLRFFGYDVNFDYFSFLNKNRESCEARLRRCKSELWSRGYENPECQLTDCIERTVENSNIIYKRNK